MGFTIPSTAARQAGSQPSAPGQSLSEYGLILGLVAIVSVGGLNMLGKNITTELANYGKSLDGQGSNMAATGQTGSPYSNNQYNTTPAASSPMPSPPPAPAPSPTPGPTPTPTPSPSPTPGPTPAPAPTPAPTPAPAPTPTPAPSPTPAPAPAPSPSSQSGGGGTPTATNGCNGCSNAWNW